MSPRVAWTRPLAGGGDGLLMRTFAVQQVTLLGTRNFGLFAD